MNVPSPDIPQEEFFHLQVCGISYNRSSGPMKVAFSFFCIGKIGSIIVF